MTFDTDIVTLFSRVAQHHAALLMLFWSRLTERGAPENRGPGLIAFAVGCDTNRRVANNEPSSGDKMKGDSGRVAVAYTIQRKDRQMSYDNEGNPIPEKVPLALSREASEEEQSLTGERGAKGKVGWYLSPSDSTMGLKKEKNIFIRNLADKYFSNKNKEILIDKLSWSVLARNVLRGKNTLLFGPTGTGKTSIAIDIAVAMGRPYFYFNIGQSVDPQSLLLGNTFFKNGVGTFFKKSIFVEAITTEKAVIVLDEVNRGNIEAENILFPVLDPTVRRLLIDISEHSESVEVARGVIFIATANIGSEYTGTKTMDRAFLERFHPIEISSLSLEDERKLLKTKFPRLSKQTISAIAGITDATRKAVKGEAPMLSDCVSSRTAVEVADLVNDGFSLMEAVESRIFPIYSDDGGLDSERTHIRQLAQGFIDIESEDEESSVAPSLIILVSVGGASTEDISNILGSTLNHPPDEVRAILASLPAIIGSELPESMKNTLFSLLRQLEAQAIHHPRATGTYGVVLLDYKRAKGRAIVDILVKSLNISLEEGQRLIRNPPAIFDNYFTKSEARLLRNRLKNKKARCRVLELIELGGKS